MGTSLGTGLVGVDELSSSGLGGGLGRGLDGTDRGSVGVGIIAVDFDTVLASLRDLVRWQLGRLERNWR